MKNKLFILILLLVLSVGLISCNDEPTEEVEEIEEESQVVTYDLVVSYTSEGSVFNTSLTFDPNDLTNSDYSTFNYNLCKLGLLVCLDQHYSCDIINKANEGVSLLESLGFTNVVSTLVDTSEQTDIYDTTNMTIASGTFNKDYVVINLSFQGTSGTNEWKSNFDMGADVSEYTNTTGEHPEWIDKTNHKGFEVAAIRSLKVIKDYVGKLALTSNQKVVFFVNGYSRGAAIANIIGAKLIDQVLDINCSYQTLTYSFATPASTTNTNAKAAKYNAIHNLINADDVVPMLPPQQIGFTRYGQDTSASVKDSEELKQAYKDLTGNDYTLTYDFNTLVQALCSTATTREAVYQINTDKDKCNKSSNSSELMLSVFREMKIKSLKSFGLDDYAYFSEITYNEETEEYEYYYSYSLSMFLELIPTILDAVEDEDTTSLLKYLSLLDGDNYSELLNEINKNLYSNDISEMLLMGHYPQSYFVILESLNK